MNWFSTNVKVSPLFTTSTFACLSICLSVGLFGGSLTGCSDGPSYSELVTVYNAELQALDRLEGKREALIVKHEAATGLSAGDVADTLNTLLSSAKEAGASLNLEGVTDSNELLDRAVEHAEKAEGITSGILEAVSAAEQPTAEETQQQAEATAQFDQDLAALDQEIAEQKDRVERARKARDKADPAQK
jgi:hypothetical protein